jgi:hypothetical protein
MKDHLSESKLAIIFALAITSLVAINTDALAGETVFTARALDSLCEPLPNQTPAMLQEADDMCGVYILGFVDALNMMQWMHANGKAVCIPTDVTISANEARRIFQGYIHTHSELVDNTARAVVLRALLDAYPCPNE